MADENTEGAGVEADAADGGDTRTNDEQRKAFAERDKAKGEARELKTRLAQYEAKERDEATAKERQAGDWSKLEQRYKKDLEQVTAERDEALGKLADLDKGGRRAKFAEAIVAEAKGGNVRTVSKLLPTLGLEDDAPESFNTLDVKKALKAFNADHPELFSKAPPTIKPAPGSGNRPPDPNTAEHWKQKAGERSQRSLGTSYLNATGRSDKQ